MDNVNPYRNDTEGYCIEDLAVCISASFAKTVTEEDIWLFSSVSGDINPVHLDQAYAEKTRLKGRISHGMLSASFIAPVRPGETVTARLTVAKVVPQRSRAILQTRCYIDETLVIDGEALLLVPTRHQH